MSSMNGVIDLPTVGGGETTNMANKSAYKIAFKSKVVAFIAKRFSRRDNYTNDSSMFHQWFRKRDELMEKKTTSDSGLHC
jgi:hypothetical protein